MKEIPFVFPNPNPSASDGWDKPPTPNGVVVGFKGQAVRVRLVVDVYFDIINWDEEAVRVGGMNAELKLTIRRPRDVRFEIGERVWVHMEYRHRPETALAVVEKYDDAVERYEAARHQKELQDAFWEARLAAEQLERQGWTVHRTRTCFVCFEPGESVP